MAKKLNVFDEVLARATMCADVISSYDAKVRNNETGEVVSVPPTYTTGMWCGLKVARCLLDGVMAGNGPDPDDVVVRMVKAFAEVTSAEACDVDE